MRTGRRLPIIVMLAVLAASCGSTPAALPARVPHTPETVAALEQQRLAALGRADADSLAPMFHPDLVVTLGSLVRTRDQILERMREQAKSGLVIDETGEDISVRIHGDAAIATGFAVTIDGDGVKKQARFTSVWIWSDGRWQLVAGHVSPTETPPSSHRDETPVTISVSPDPIGVHTGIQVVRSVEREIVSGQPTAR